MNLRLAPMGVRWRVTVAVSLLFAVTLAGGAAILLERIERVLVGDVHDSARVELEHVRAMIASDGTGSLEGAPTNDGGVSDDAASPQAQDLEVIEVPEIDSMIVMDGSGVVSMSLHADQGAGDTESGATGIMPATELRAEMAERGEPLPEWLESSDESIAVTSVPAADAVGSARLLSATPLDAVRQTVDTARRAFFAAVPVLIALIGLSAWAVAGRALRPVDAITRQADDITGATLHARVPVPDTGDEVARLARTMNGMLNRLEQASASQRRLTSDAAHELRTPVTTIRTELEVALREHDPDWDAVAQRVLAEDVRLGTLVDDLLLLARDDETAASSPTEELDLDHVVLDAAARRRSLPIVTSAVQPARIHGDPIDLGRATDHLLDNAVRHAERVVEVGVRTQPDGSVVLTVDDDGNGIPAADRDRVFERFARLDEARSRDRGGAGLGLPVVGRIISRHGGQVTVTDAPVGGARITVTFPPQQHPENVEIEELRFSRRDKPLPL